MLLVFQSFCSFLLLSNISSVSYCYFIHSLGDGYLGCLEIMSKADVFCYTFLLGYLFPFFLDKYLGVELPSCMVVCI